MRGIKLLLIAVVLGASSCSYQDVVMQELADVGLSEVTNEKVRIDIQAKIENPNNYPITIVSSDLDIYISGKRIGNTALDKKVKLPKKSSEIHTVSLETDLKSLKKGLLPSLFSALTDQSLTVRLKGKIKARVIIVGKKFDVDYSEKVKLDGLFNF